MAELYSCTLNRRYFNSYAFSYPELNRPGKQLVFSKNSFSAFYFALKKIIPSTVTCHYRIETGCVEPGFLARLCFGEGGKVYCYADFYCYSYFSIVFGQNFKGAQNSKREEGNCVRKRASCPSCGRKPGVNVILDDFLLQY